jgi:zinc/manganese transport system substrate-binding protein
MILGMRTRLILIHGSRSRKVGAMLAAALLAAAAAGCGDAAPEDDETAGPAIVVSNSILADLTRQVTGDDVDLEVLMGLGQDPHAFAPSASQASALESADLVIAFGLGLEAGLDDVLAGIADGGRLLEVGPAVDPLPFGEAGADGDREDDDHGAFDPHVWFDPLRMARAVSLIGDRLAAVDPERAEAWVAAAEMAAADLTALDQELAGVLEGIPAQRRLLVTNHDVLGYFAARYDFEVVGVVVPGGSTLAEPSPADLADLVDAIVETGATAIFAETTQPIRLAEVVAAEVGRRVAVVELFTESLGEEGSGAETYANMMRLDAERIAEALGG